MKIRSNFGVELVRMTQGGKSVCVGCGALSRRRRALTEPQTFSTYAAFANPHWPINPKRKSFLPEPFPKIEKNLPLNLKNFKNWENLAHFFMRAQPQAMRLQSFFIETFWRSRLLLSTMKEPEKREKLIFNLFGKTDFFKTFKIRKIFRKGLMISDQACPKKSVDFI